MPGKVLIIDDIATNRIVLKVKLAAACYQVSQAATGDEGLAMARATRPDLILCSARMPDMDAIALTGALRADPATATIPLLVVTASRDRDLRLAALAAGADDILLKPLDEHLLLARMRSLLRARDTAEELRLRDGANRALGFAEMSQAFDQPGKIALVAPTTAEALRWKSELHHHLADRLLAISVKDAMRQLAENDVPDAFAIRLDVTGGETELRLLSDLRARAETRHSGVLAVITGDAPRLAAEALDRGANDVMTEGFDAPEMALRLTAQIAQKRLADRLRANMRDGLRAAITDPLTGLHNRRYAMPHLARIADQAAQTGRDYAVMVIDLDHFKLVNDRFGHAAGDAVLVRVAELLRENMRSKDLVARIGGEEFLIAMPDTDRRLAQFAAKRLCGIIRDTPVAVPGHNRPLTVTVSIGVALGSDHALTDTAAATPPAILERADKALYGSKAQGRNQVTLCNHRPAA